MPIAAPKINSRWAFALMFCAAHVTLAAYDDIHPFRPILFAGEPRFIRDRMTTITATLTRGSSHTQFTPCGRKAPLGCPPPPSAANAIFSMTEVVVNLWQNLSRGLFTNIYIPIRELSLVSKQACAPIATTPANYIKQGIGDIAWGWGWALAYEDTETADFVDLTLETGIAIPTSPTHRPTSCLDFPIGYDGRVGWYVGYMNSIGFFDWLTLGSHAQCLVFNSIAHPNTHSEPRLPGISASLYLKADHFLGGFSCILGYSGIWQLCRTHDPRSACTTTPCTWGNKWSQQIFHFTIEYDCATFENPYAPRIALLYSKTCAGKNVIDLSTVGGTWDMTIGWSF